MKKIQIMFATVLVALMAVAVTSCGSDKDSGTTDYKLEASFNVQEKGEFSDAEIQKLKEAYAQSAVNQFITDQQAEADTDSRVQKTATQLKTVAANTGTSTAKFTITVTTTNLKTNKQVCKWDIVWDKGSVSTQKY